MITAGVEASQPALSACPLLHTCLPGSRFPRLPRSCARRKPPQGSASQTRLSRSLRDTNGVHNNHQKGSQSVHARLTLTFLVPGMTTKSSPWLKIQDRVTCPAVAWCFSPIPVSLATRPRILGKFSLENLVASEVTSMGSRQR